jgi:hypothetical protein
VLGYYSPDGPGSGPLQPTASQTTITKSVSLAERPDGATSFALLNGEQHSIAGRPTTEQHGATEQSSVSGQPPIAKDPSRYHASVRETAVAKKDPTQYYGSIPVALVHAWKSGEQSAMADIEAAPSTVMAAHPSSAATHIHASHASRRMGRHEPRSVFRVKPTGVRAHNEPRRMAGVAAHRVQHSQIRNVR